MAGGGIELAPLLVKLKADISEYEADMKKASDMGVSEADKISKKMSETANVGKKLSEVGTALTLGLTVPIIGVGVASTKMAIDYQSSFAKVSTLLDDNTTDFGAYSDALIQGSNGSKIAVGEFSDAVYESISSGVSQGKAIEFTTQAMKLAKGGFTEGAKAVDILTTAINAYGLKAEDSTKISDMLITTQNLGKTTVDELSSSMGRVIPTANAFGVGMSNVSTAIADLTANGIATAEATTYLNSMLNELGSSGTVADKAIRELSGKGFKELMDSGVPLTDILGMLKTKATESGKSLGDMFGSTEAAKAALTIMKDDGATYNDFLNQMENSAGATQKAFEKINATPAEKLSGALNKLKNAGIKLGSAFVPVVVKVANSLSDMADSFSALNEEQQENIIKWGLVLAATGPALKVLGGGITTYANLSKAMAMSSGVIGSAGSAGTLVGGLSGLLTVAPLAAAAAVGVGLSMYTIHEEGQLMNRTVLDSKEKLSGMEKALAFLHGTEVKSKKELEELGYVHKEFSGDISKEFQSAVEESTKKVQDFNVYLKEIGFDGVITAEESNDFNSKVSEMCTNAINTINSKKEESQAALTGLFQSDGIVTDNEQKVLSILSQSSDNQVAEVQQLSNDILAIKEQAVTDGRALNEQEIADIEAKRSRIAQIELESLGGTQDEIAYAKNEFAARIKTMDLQSASDLLQDKAKIRDEEVVKISASYDTEIGNLKAHLGEQGGVNDEALKTEITNLEKSKADKITQQKDLYSKYMDIIKEENPKLLDEINRYNGKILKGEDFSSQDMLSTIQSRYQGINQITKSGCYTMYNTVDENYSQVAVKIDEKTGEIIALHDKTNNLTGAYSVSMANSVQKMADSQSASFAQVVSAEGFYIDESGNVVNASSGVSSAMYNVKTATDGTRQGIVDINGTPYNITVNKDGTIAALNAINAAANEATKERTLRIMVKQDGSIKTPGELTLSDRAFGSQHFNGLDSVPYDGYHAVLHKDERVLTAEENRAYTGGTAVDYNTISKIVSNAVSGLVIELNGRQVGRALQPILEERGM